MNRHHHIPDHDPLPGSVMIALVAACLWLGGCSGAAPEPEATATPTASSPSAPPTPTKTVSIPTRWIPTSGPGVVSAKPYLPPGIPTPWAPKTPTPRTQEPTRAASALSYAYALDCKTGYYTLLDRPTGSVWSTSYIAAGDSECRGYWTGDGRRVAFSNDDAVYVWTMGDRDPDVAFVYRAPPEAFTHEVRQIWSPDGDRLAVTEEYWVMPDPSEWAHNSVATGGVTTWVYDAGTSKLVMMSVGYEFYEWFTNDLLRLGCSDCFLCHASTGVVVCGDKMWEGYPSCTPGLSPDRHWFAAQTSIGFVIYDLRRGPGASLSTLAPGNELQFVTWSQDSSRIYFINRPSNAFAQADPAIPFGWLVYYPATQKQTMLFEQAVEAYLSPDQEWALVIYPSRHETDQLGLAATLYYLTTSETSGVAWWPDQTPYADKAAVPGPQRDRRIMAAVWTEDSRRVRVWPEAGGSSYVLEVPEP